MIVVISGTREGKEISALLSAKGYEVLTVTAVNHGSRIVVYNSVNQVKDEYHIKNGWEKLINSNNVRLIINAAHPGPGGISGSIRDISRENGIPYIRLVRQELHLPDSPLLFPVYSWTEAAQKAAELGDTIFLTTGSYNLETFLKHPGMACKRVVVRVLPDYQVIEKVQALGIVPKDIVAMQGPFSREMNRVTFKLYNASVIVTKDSGKAGGTDNKISAAISLKIPVVIIKRARQTEEDDAAVETIEDVLQKAALLLGND